MKRTKRGIHTLLFVLVLFVSLVMSSGTANATSDYDDVFAAASSARVSDTYDDHTCFVQDIATSWSTYLMDDSKWSQAVYGSGTDRETVQAALSTTLGNGDGWAVTERRFTGAGTSIGDYVYGHNDYGVQVVFTPDADNEVTFFTYGGLEYAPLKGTGSAPVYVVILGQYWNYLTSTCSVGVAVSRVVASNASNAGFVSKEAYVGMTSTTNYTFRQLFVNSPINQTDYEGLVPSSVYVVPPAKYVAMGDSFSSGEGNPSFESGTDEDGVDECHRSPKAYPRLLSTDPDNDLWPVAFVACSGATTFDVLGSEDDNPTGMWDEPSQISALSSDTQVVTLTIGGNDVEFSAFAEKCISPANYWLLDEVCDEYTPIYDEVTGLIANSLPGQLQSLYEVLLEEAPNAQIYIGGYPTISPNKAITDPYDEDCPGLEDEFPNSWGDARAAHEVVNLLNATIEDTVNSVNYQQSTTRLHFVSVSNGAFSGHDACQSGSDNYFNGVDIVNREYSVHPNADGQLAYMTDFEAEIN